MVMNAEAGASVRMLRLPEVLQKVGGSRTWWYGLIRKGDAPEPVRYSPKHSVWPESDIDAWIAQRLKKAGRA